MSTNTQAQTIESRVIKAAARYLTNHGYEIIDTLNDTQLEDVCNLVALTNDKSEVIFLNLSYTSIAEDLDKGEEPTRQQFEQVAVKWLFSGIADTADKAIRFDSMRLVIMGDDDRALIRHHVNCIN